MKQEWTIRLEEPKDYAAVEFVTREAFWNVHVPGCNEHYLAHVLRDAASFLPELDYIAEHDDGIIGNIMYTRAVVRGDDGMDRSALCFGPLSVLPQWQKQGVGSALVRFSLETAQSAGHAAVLIYGNPAYYGRFGFAAAERYGIGTPDGFYADALQALELIPGALEGAAGLFFEDAAFEVDDTEAERFDEAFPKKVKRTGLPSQLLFQKQLTMRKPRE